MNDNRKRKISESKAINAFDYAACELICEKTKRKAKKCISEEGGCIARVTFIKKIQA